MTTNQEDLQGLDNALAQAERHLKHARIHLRDARMMMADDTSYELGLTPADRTELQRLLRFLDENIGTVLSSGDRTRPILDRAEVV
jgi:hypothetical protein